MNNVLFAFGLTLFAGLCTGIGSCLAFFTKKTDTKFLSICLGFSAGIMLYVSMVEIFFESKSLITSSLGKSTGSWINVIAFFSGILFIALIDQLIPSGENPHDIYRVENINKNKKLLRIGIFTAIAIAIHNFPEGISTFISSLHNPSIGIPITMAVAIHNIPEGIAVSVPVYYSTGSKGKAFLYSFLSGLSEPLGAIMAYLVLMPFISDLLLGIIFAAVAGIMVFISLDELLPSAREYGEPHHAMYGLVSGMAVMAVSLLLFM